MFHIFLVQIDCDLGYFAECRPFQNFGEAHAWIKTNFTGVTWSNVTAL